MIGTILVEGLEIECIVGILPGERESEQVLFVDVELDVDFALASVSENVAQTVDYVELARVLTDLAVERRFQLIETFAEEAAALVISRFAAERVRLKIMKPAAVPNANWAAVRVERFR